MVRIETLAPPNVGKAVGLQALVVLTSDQNCVSTLEKFNIF